MKKILIIITMIIIVIAPPIRADTQTITFEIGIGFSTSGTIITPINCTESSLYGAIRYRYNNMETHIGGWVGDNCNQNSSVIGVGYVIDTRNFTSHHNANDYYLTYTPGLAYNLSTNKPQLYNRISVGGGTQTNSKELGIVQYSDLIKNNNSTNKIFFTVSIGRIKQQTKSTKSTKSQLPNSTSIIVITNNTNNTSPPNIPVTISTPPPSVPAPSF